MAKQFSEKPSRFARVGAGWKAVSGGVATVAAATGVLTAFGVVGGGSEGPPPSVAVASAASKATDAGSSKVLVTLIETPRTAPGEPAVTLGAGEFDYRRGRGRIEYDLSRRKGLEDLYSVEVRFDGPSFFVRDRGIFDLPKGKRWLRVAFADLANVRGSSLALVSDLGIEDPTRALKSLQLSTSGVKAVGAEELRGERTTHYVGRRDADGAGPAPPTTVNVWVDESGYLRKLETTTRTASKTVTTRTELDDFGVDVDTRLPPRGRVYDFARGR